jgi:hypothetical protein
VKGKLDYNHLIRKAEFTLPPFKSGAATEASRQRSLYRGFLGTRKVLVDFRRAGKEIVHATLIKWANEGRIKAQQDSTTKQWEFEAESVRAFIEAYRPRRKSAPPQSRALRGHDHEP